MEGWVNVGSLIAVRPRIEPTTAWSQVRRPNRYAIRTPDYDDDDDDDDVDLMVAEPADGAA